MARSAHPILCGFLLLANPSVAQEQVHLPGLASQAEGADVVVTNLDGDPRPELLLMAYDTPAGGPNTFRYMVGLNAEPNGSVSSLSQIRSASGVEPKGSGAGAGVTNLDGDSRPELIFLAQTTKAGSSTFRYKVGWNIARNGTAQYWDTNFIEVGGEAVEAEGADVLLTNLDDNDRPEMIVTTFGPKGNEDKFVYKVGWNLNRVGKAQRWDPDWVTVSGGQWTVTDIGTALSNLDLDPRPEMILAAYVDTAGRREFRIKVGWNLGTDGRADVWEPNFRTQAGFGFPGDGAGLSSVNFDEDAEPELLLAAYDAGTGMFWQRTIDNFGLAQKIHLEIDKLATVGWPPASVNRDGVDYTLERIYARLGIALSVHQNEGDIPNLLGNGCFTDADLDGLRQARMNNAPQSSDEWHMYTMFVTCHVDGPLGIMFDTGERRAFSVFMNEFAQTDKILRTTAHELGHALCLYHTDGDAWRATGPVPHEGRTIMNQTAVLAGDWGFGWYAPEAHELLERSKRRWAPRSGFAFGACR
ncbi:hypothetical protein GOC07_30540 [Sinorhizobium meliloti]|nr:hypothetical protein [Sinorhizobium meliloti]